jgi:beta-lactamase regulating signal transducer with metallopeptidase domain
VSAVPAFVAWLDGLAEHGAGVALGATALLALGAAVVRAQRAPADQRRLGLLCLGGTGLFVALALLPLPRWAPALDVAAPPRAARAAAAPIAAIAEPRAAAPTEVGSAVPDPSPAESPAAERIPFAAPWPAPANAPSSTPARAPTANVPTPPPPGDLPVGRWCAALWLATAVLMALRAGCGLWRLGRLLRRCRPGPASLGARAGLPPGTRLAIADVPVRPFCTGWRSPLVVLPADLLAPERTDQALAVLRHEAAHVRARDPLAQMLIALLALPLALHPLFWWLVVRVRFASELLADDAAAADHPTAYARSLLTLADDAAPAPRAIGTVAVFQRPSDFCRRIQMLLQRDGRLSPGAGRRPRLVQACASFALVAAAATLFGVPAPAQDPEGRAQRKQEAALRAEIDVLRAELEALRKLLHDRAAAGPSTDVVSTDPTPAAPDLFELLQPKPKRPTAVTATPAPTDIAPVEEPPPPDAPAPPGTPSPTPDAFAPLLLEVARQAPNGVEYRAFLDLLAQRPTTAPAPTDPTDVFLPGPDGLPSHRVSLPAPERTATVPTTEAIVDLASRALDAQGDLELAETEAAEKRRLADAGHLQPLEARRAEVRARVLQRKLGILHRLIEGEIEATASEMQWLEQSLAAAEPTDRLRLQMQLQRARTRLDALRAAK